MYVMHLNSTCNQNKSKESIFVEQRDEKEVPTKSYGRGNGIFPPPPHPLVVFGTNGGMAKKCKLFLSNLTYKLSRNNVESYASAISWLETCISFEILTSLHTCGEMWCDGGVCIQAIVFLSIGLRETKPKM